MFTKLKVKRSQIKTIKREKDSFIIESQKGDLIEYRLTPNTNYMCLNFQVIFNKILWIDTTLELKSVQKQAGEIWKRLGDIEFNFRNDQIDQIKDDAAKFFKWNED